MGVIPEKDDCITGYGITGFIAGNNVTWNDVRNF